MTELKLSDQFETPKWLYDILDNRFSFDIDLCATEQNKKVQWYCDDLLSEYEEEWGAGVKSGFMNPPYSKPWPFIQKAISFSFIVVMILPVDTSTKWWNKMITHLLPKHRMAVGPQTNEEFIRHCLDSPFGFHNEIIYLPQRVKFEYQGKPTLQGGLRASCIVIVRSSHDS